MSAAASSLTPSWSELVRAGARRLDATRFAALAARELTQIDSTNSELLRQAHAGQHYPQVLWAHQQSAGRGRMGRAWLGGAADQAPHTAPATPAQAPPHSAYSPHSTCLPSLFLSLALPFAPLDWSGLSLVVGLAVAEQLGAEIALKWPNDLCVRQTGGGYAKLGGILLETAALPPHFSAPALPPHPSLDPNTPPRWLVIGLGLNLSNTPATPDLRAPAIDLAQALAPERAQTLLANPAQLCADLVLAILQKTLHFEQTGFAPFAPDFAARDLLLGQSVCSLDAQGAVQHSGQACGVAADGGYQIRPPNGALHTLHSAEISLRPTPL